MRLERPQGIAKIRLFTVLFSISTMYLAGCGEAKTNIEDSFEAVYTETSTEETDTAVDSSTPAKEIEGDTDSILSKDMTVNNTPVVSSLDEISEDALSGIIQEYEKQALTNDPNFLASPEVRDYYFYDLNNADFEEVKYTAFNKFQYTSAELHTLDDDSLNLYKEALEAETTVDVPKSILAIKTQGEILKDGSEKNNSDTSQTVYGFFFVLNPYIDADGNLKSATSRQACFVKNDFYGFTPIKENAFKNGGFEQYTYDDTVFTYDNGYDVRTISYDADTSTARFINSAE